MRFQGRSLKAEDQLKQCEARYNQEVAFYQAKAGESEAKLDNYVEEVIQ